MKWISVDDRLPEKYGEYIVAFDYGQVGTNLWHSKDVYRGKVREAHWAYNGHEHITHWMPMPEHPGRA